MHYLYYLGGVVGSALLLSKAIKNDCMSIKSKILSKVFLKGIRFYNNLINLKKSYFEKENHVYCFEKIHIYYESKKKYDEYILIIRDGNFKRANLVIDNFLKKEDVKYLKIEYNFKGKIYYKILTKKNLKERKDYFPPYPEDLESLEEKQILSAMIGDKDITNEIAKYAGPKGNFYKDIGLDVYLYHVINNKNKEIVLDLKKEEKLIILDSELEEKEYKSINEKLL